MVDQERVQIFLSWYLETSAVTGTAETVTARYFVYTSIEISVAENIGVNMEFVLDLKEKW